MNDDDTVIQVENQGAHSSMNSDPELVEEGIWCNFSFKLWHECNITCVHDVEYRIWCMLCEFVIT